MSPVVPARLQPLFWDIDPRTLSLPEHADYIVERIMSRGGWDAMCWLRATFPPATLADFLARKGDRLAPRERAYWDLIAGTGAPQRTGGGRPPWAGS